MYRNHTIAVVVPAYDEESLIGRVIEMMPEYVDRIVVVDDASQDGTAEAVRRMSERLLRPDLTGLVQAHKGEVGRLGGSRALDEAYVEACRTLGPVRCPELVEGRLWLFDLRVMADM